MKAVLAILLIAFVSSETLVGGWVKRSFEENDMYINRARVAAEKKYFEQTNSDDSTVDVTPVSIYSQLVNGLNFKIILAARNMNTNDLTMHEFTIYNGPFGSQEMNTPQITGVKELQQGKPLLFAAASYTNIHKAIARFYSTENAMSHVSTVVPIERTIDDMRMFIASAMVGEEKKTCILVQENGELNQIAEIKSY